VFLFSLTSVFICIFISNIISAWNWCDPDVETCPLDVFCIGCDNKALTYFAIVYTFIITIFFLLPVGYLCAVQIGNYTMNKTTNERFARQARTMSAVSDLDAFSSSRDSSTMRGGENLDSILLDHKFRPKKRKGCLGNCIAMCCSYEYPSQQYLLEKHKADYASSIASSAPDSIHEE
jgi:hypothetical protein